MELELQNERQHIAASIGEKETGKSVKLDQNIPTSIENRGKIPEKCVPQIFNIAANVILGRWIEVFLVPLHRWRDTRCLYAHLPESAIVLVRRHLATEQRPSVLVQRVGERQENDFRQCLSVQFINFGLFVTNVVLQQSNGFEVLWCRCGQSECIADGLMEAGIGPVAEDMRLISVLQEVINVAHFVENGEQIVHVDAGALLYAGNQEIAKP